jgi:hypothetical protein
MRTASPEERIVLDFLQGKPDWFEQSSPAKIQDVIDKSGLFRSRSAHLVRIDANGNSKEQVLDEMQMLRLCDARNADLGKGSVIDKGMTT